MKLQEALSLEVSIIQAPMAGVSTPAMAAAVSNAGALGSISVGAAGAVEGRKMIRAVRLATDRPFNVNVFCHRPAIRNEKREMAWLEYLRPHFAKFNAKPPERLREIYTTFLNDDAMLQVLLEERPRVVSFHFGLPSAERIAALKSAGIYLLATATCPEEGRAIAAAGIDAVVAQGYEAGGHHGNFDPDQPGRFGALQLTQQMARELEIPVIAAGGIMTGGHIAAALLLGASGAQLGTAFIGCPESSADAGFRKALFSDAAQHSVITRVISGRRAGCLTNLFTAIGDDLSCPDIPDYPVAYDAGKALNAVAKAAGETGYSAHLAGYGARLARPMSAGELVACLRAEMEKEFG